MPLDFLFVCLLFALLCFCFLCCLIVQLGRKNLINLVNLAEWVKQWQSRISTCNCILRVFLNINESDISTILYFNSSSVTYWESQSLQGSFIPLGKVRGPRCRAENHSQTHIFGYMIASESGAWRCTSQMCALSYGAARLVVIPSADQLTII